MNTEKLKKLQAQVIDWATERGIYKKSDAYMQLLKTGEEILELLGAIHQEDEDEIKDALGDIQVCLINYCRFKKLNFTVYISSNEDYITNRNLLHILADLLVSDSSLSIRGYLLEFCDRLNLTANEYNLDLLDCLESAYNVIKNRKGKMINGQFVKEK